MDKTYNCIKCNKEFHIDYRYYKDGYVCDKCVSFYSDKFYELFNIRDNGMDQFDVSISIEDFIRLVDVTKFDHNSLRLIIDIKDLRE